MKYRHAFVALLLSIATVAIAQQQPRQDRSSRHSSRTDRRSTQAPSYATTHPTNFLEAYRLVLDRNIFSKTRVIYREASSTTLPTGYLSSSSSSQIQPALTLTGVTRESGTTTALIEDRRSGRTSFYHLGDTLENGKITAIDLDSIEYTLNNGQAARVALGNPLLGGPTYAVSASSGTSAPTTGPSSFGAAPASSGSGGDTNDLIERLRQRRLQETKR
jgi:hypothetical protein